MLNRLRFLQIIVVSFVVCMVVCCASNALAQSGRKVPKTKPAAVPMPTPEPATTSKPKEEVKPTLTLIVGMERLPGYTNVPITYFRDVLEGCIEQLEKKPTVKVVRLSSDINRGEAARRARAETESYVVFLQLKSDSMSGDFENGGDIVVEYWVFSPGTAKLATSGRTYPSTYRNKSVILNPRTANIYGNYRLRQAGEEAADRIVSALLNYIPPKKSPSLAD